MANVKAPKTRAPKLAKAPGATKVTRGKQVIDKKPLAKPRPMLPKPPKGGRNSGGGYYSFTGGKPTHIPAPIRPLIP